MTLDHLERVFCFLKGYLEQNHVIFIKDGEPIQHALWMCMEMRARLDEVLSDGDMTPPELQAVKEKACRWLGFIQGVLYCQNIFTIDEMREMNRSSPG